MALQSRNGSLPRLSRREWLTLAAAGIGLGASSSWLQTLAADAARNPQRKRSCILLWMSGGPSQMDTFDLKPGHANGGPFKAIATATPGIQISEHLPQIAKQMDRMVLVRSMSTKEGDHGRATFLLRTGYLPQGPITYPPIGALVAHQLAGEELDLPSFVSVSPTRGFSPQAFTSGFLGPQFAPLIVGEGGIPMPNANTDFSEALKVQDLAAPAGVTNDQVNARLEILRNLESDFVRERPSGPALGHQTAYERAVRLMRSPAAKAFNLEEEPDALRDAYGRSGFGQGCMLARRLVERGVPFVEVTLSGVDGDPVGWDTHQNNFDRIKRLSGVLDPAFGTLMTDLKQRGLLDTTTIVWMGEFGRTPKITPAKGRDHFPTAWSTVIAGGGLKGGQVVGKTSPDGMSVEDRAVSVPDLLATVCLALGIDFKKQNNSNVGRPIRIVDKAAKPITEVIA
jgi:hypothetical protein